MTQKSQYLIQFLFPIEKLSTRMMFRIFSKKPNHGICHQNIKVMLSESVALLPTIFIKQIGKRCTSTKLYDNCPIWCLKFHSKLQCFMRNFTETPHHGYYSWHLRLPIPA